MSFCHGCIDVAGQRSLFVKAESLARLLKPLIPRNPVWADIRKLHHLSFFVFKGTFTEKKYYNLCLMYVNLLLKDVFNGDFGLLALVI